MLIISAFLGAHLGQSGRSSGVERNLAKVEVVGSNPIARSILLIFIQLPIYTAKILMVHTLPIGL